MNMLMGFARFLLATSGAFIIGYFVGAKWITPETLGIFADQVAKWATPLGALGTAAAAVLTAIANSRKSILRAAVQIAEPESKIVVSDPTLAAQLPDNVTAKPAQ